MSANARRASSMESSLIEPEQSSKKTTSEAVQYGGLVECLLREYGGDPDRWLYETPLPMIETLMNNFSARVNAESDAARKSSGASGVAVAPVADERLRALRNFRLKAVEIQERWNDGEESC